MIFYTYIFRKKESLDHEVKPATFALIKCSAILWSTELMILDDYMSFRQRFQYKFK